MPLNKKSFEILKCDKINVVKPKLKENLKRSWKKSQNDVEFEVLKRVCPWVVERYGHLLSLSIDCNKHVA